MVNSTVFFIIKKAQTAADERQTPVFGNDKDIDCVIVEEQKGNYTQLIPDR